MTIQDLPFQSSRFHFLMCRQEPVPVFLLSVIRVLAKDARLQNTSLGHIEQLIKKHEFTESLPVTKI